MAAEQLAVAVVGGNGSLYVGDLERNVNEAQLYDLFCTVAPVVSVRVCRDQISHTSLGYAYVNFTSYHDASIARETLNFTAVNGRPIRIMFSHRDPSMRKSGSGNVFIKNLDASINHRFLYNTFKAFGNVLSCKVATNHSGQSKGYGFVQFDNDASAQKAIQELDGMLMNEKKVYVGLYIRRNQRGTEQGSQKYTNVYVKNLLDSTTDEDLKSLFGKFGDITSVVVMKDSDGRSRCFGFVNFKSTDAAAAAVEGLNGTSFGADINLFVARAQKKTEREAELREKYEIERKNRYNKLQGANLYLKNLDEDINEQTIQEMFSDFGTVTSCKILRNPLGRSNGAGFVAFSTVEDASKALTAMNGRLVANKPLYVAVAQRKEERRAQLQAHFAQMRLPFLPMQGYQYSGPSRFSPQQLYYGQAGLMPPQYIAYGYLQPFFPGVMRPAVPSNFGFPGQHFQRGSQRGRYYTPRRSGNSQPPQQQWMPRNNNQGGRYVPNGRQRIGSSQESAGPSTMPAQQLPISENQHAMLGEQLFPLVQQQPDNANNVTGMLLEMDQTEVLHLIESPDAL